MHKSPISTAPNTLFYTTTNTLPTPKTHFGPITNYTLPITTTTPPRAPFVPPLPLCYNPSMNPPLPIYDPAVRRAISHHPRLWHDNRYVYAVLSRRSKGVSIGINLNPDKVCNFDCIYCSVDRKIPLPSWASRHLDLDTLRAELASMLDLAATGQLYNFPPFDVIPASLRRVNDIAFSGDGEPTTSPQFRQIAELTAELAESTPQLPTPIKLILITNASMFHKPDIQGTLAFLDQHHGEIWAKLDAGTADYYRLIDRSGVPFDRILQNLTWCCQTRPTVIQTLLMKVHNTPPSAAEIAAYISRLRDIRAAGGTIQLVQLYTTARNPAEPYVTPFTADELEAVAHPLRDANFPVETYP
jgi:wyosine [tRNA(Phe)-imidazoG37] synthetase (radical SAM superfamily)